MAIWNADLGVAIEADPITSIRCDSWLGAFSDAHHVPRSHLDVAPTELAAILLSDCYKDVAPTELR